jgi:ribonuclease VapC
VSAVLDASALLAFLQGEAGASVVEARLQEPGVRCGAANWSEVAQKVRSAGRDWDLARALLLSYGLQVEPVTIEDAERAARRWTPGEGLSLADRLCLALAERLRSAAWTADTAWGTPSDVRQIR